MRKDSAIAGAVLLGLAAMVWLNVQRNEPLQATKNRSAAPQLDPTAVLESWQVVKVTDGDTIKVQRGGEELRIRFCGIDAPEKEQSLGPEATALLRQLVDQSGGEVLIDPVETDRYGRTVAEVWSNEVGLLNSEMVGQGMAFVYERYVGGCPSREAIVASGDRAEELGVGVWANPRLQKPWEYRKAQQ